ncbi:MAG: CBS domain-containing protein [Candidatus Marinimicrobia bacterium]|nr:CBS domain-containing protein [Candidatus Neomarinimicrobiota bacterium]
MPKHELEEIVTAIKENEEEFKMTSRDLIHLFDCEKRTKGNQALINKYLDDNKLETCPDYRSAWIDSEIILRHKKKAKSKNEIDPIQRIKILPAANKEPVTIKKDAELKEAVTLMMMNNFSQLPVLNGPRNIVGVITWETIGIGITNGLISSKISDYISPEITILDYDTPLLEAISTVIQKEFVVVQKSDRSICGIVTVADISEQFLTLTEPFLLLEQIENHIRQILDGKFLIEELKNLCPSDITDREVEHIDDLNFGDYIRLIEKPDNWERLKLTIDRTHFIKQLDKVRKIRNDIMHFDPEGITQIQREDLIKMSKFLTEIRKYS